MKCNLTAIEQPYSGEYKERIYDIPSPWNSNCWSWIKFEEEAEEWCCEFRGKYRGSAVSEKLRIIVVLTSDYMYLLDIKTKDLIEYQSKPAYLEITGTPFDDILVSDGYNLEIFRDREIASLEAIELPIQVDDLTFGHYEGSILKMKCEEFYNWGQQHTLLLDCVSFVVTVMEEL